MIKFCEGLPKDETGKILARQLLRSGTSVGANYRAACLAKSKPTFISKLGDVLEEADEAGYWIELLVDSGRVDLQRAAPLVKEAGELVAIAIHQYREAQLRIMIRARQKIEGREALCTVHFTLCI